MSFEKPDQKQEKIKELTGWWPKALFCLGNGVVEAYKKDKEVQSGTDTVNVTLENAARTRQTLERFDPDNVLGKSVESGLKKIGNWLLDDTEKKEPNN